MGEISKEVVSNEGTFPGGAPGKVQSGFLLTTEMKKKSGVWVSVQKIAVLMEWGTWVCYAQEKEQKGNLISYVFTIILQKET